MKEEVTITTASKLAKSAAVKLNERLIALIFETIQSDKELYEDYKELLKKSTAKNPAQTVNSTIGRTVGRIYGLKGTCVVPVSLIKTHSKLSQR